MDANANTATSQKKSCSSTISSKIRTHSAHALPNFVQSLEEDQQQVLSEHFLPFLLICRYSGCYIPCSSEDDCHKSVYYMRIVFIITLLFIATYQTTCVARHMFALNVNNVSATTTIVLLNWNFQSLVSILFFIYWQRSKSWEHVLRVLHVPQKSAGLAAATPWIRFVAIVASTLTIMLLLAALAVVLQTAGVVEADFPTSLIDIYGEWLRPVAILIFVYTLLIWLICLSSYVFITICAKFEFDYFNCRLRKMDDCASEQIFDRLMEFFMTHRELANAVRVIDRTFQIYAFVMIGTNIPSTVFSLLPLATAPSETFMHLLVGAVSVAFCIVQLISLTCVPAKLHNRIVQAEQIIYGCQKIWYPHNEKLYSLASTFIAHVNQQNLGVSLWGFAIVTKPLILTTISLTATYLAFVLQMKTHCNCDLYSNTTDLVFNYVGH